jgi:hypothetical protein
MKLDTIYCCYYENELSDNKAIDGVRTRQAFASLIGAFSHRGTFAVR